MLGIIDEEFDFDTPINNDITLDAKYVQLPRYSVTYYDKDKFLTMDSVKHGECATEKKDLQEKKFKKFVGWTLEDGTVFDFSTPITEPLELYASYKRDWKKIAAVGAGVLTGGVSLAVDSLLGLPGAVSLSTSAVMGLGAVVTNYKLKNHERELIDTENLTSIKKAGIKIVNYFRNSNNINNLKTFFKTAFVSTLLTGAGKSVSDNFIFDTSQPSIGSR